ncbi:MAG: aminotransferase class V-fold PLP-dependent enzyme [Candidatus Thiodiazotropha sp. (ex Notomyrtea botanica)]|nr:aminotransferase class V-fold PLP-dependent enzyme [Candidatus Thiodiazotropha sp. (ex Notomyrtea botanica)]
MSSHHFSLDPHMIYLNHAAVAPWPNLTVEAVARFAQENGSTGAMHYPAWIKTESALRSQLAQLINAPSPEDIALLKSTSEGLSVIAHGIDWEAGDNIVSIAQEFPSNRIVWQSLEPKGVEVRLLDLTSEDEPEAALMSLCDDNTRLLSVSSVQYASGRRMQLPRLGRFCQERQILFVIDAIQSLGALSFDVVSSQADVVVADGHKWMLGPEGLALFYCSETLREQLQLRQFGWHMVENAWDFDRQDWEPATSARRFECGSPNMLGIHALHSSLGLLLEMGVEKVSHLIERNCDEIIAQVDARGFELLTPRDPQSRAGIVTFRVPDRDNAALQQQLMDTQVVCACRGGGIRFSPHFHNTDSQIMQAFERLDRLIAR